MQKTTLTLVSNNGAHKNLHKTCTFSPARVYYLSLTFPIQTAKNHTFLCTIPIILQIHLEISRFLFSEAVSSRIYRKTRITMSRDAFSHCFCTDLDRSGLHKSKFFSDGWH